MATDYVALYEALDQNLQILERKKAWWLDPHNIAFNLPLMGGFNLWKFTILPMFPDRFAYRKDLDAIIIHPIWTSFQRDRQFAATVTNIPKFVKFARSLPSIQADIANELSWIEQTFNISIPSSISASILRDAEKIAKRRWGVDRLRVKDQAIPLDGSKPYVINSWGNRSARFPKGEPMTVEEVAAIVGPEFQEMNENPPPSVIKVREEMEAQSKKAGDRRRLTWIIAAVGKAQRAILDYVNEAGQPVELTSMVRHPSFRMMNFADIQRAAEVLNRRGEIRMTNEGPDRGLVLSKVATDWHRSKDFSDFKNDRAAAVAYARYVQALWDTEDKREEEKAERELTAMGFNQWGVHLDTWPLAKKEYLRLGGREEDLHFKLAATGLYGFTKAVQSSCESCTRRLAKTAVRLARTAYMKDNDVVGFLQTHAKRGRSESARILLAAMREIGPKVAHVPPALQERRAVALQSRLKAGGRTAVDMLIREAGAPEMGMYGFKARTADLGLDACRDLRSTAGRLASELHSRHSDSHEKITGFLREHAKQAKCLYSRMILSCYPDAPVEALAAPEPETPKTATGPDSWLAWEDEGRI